MKDLDICKRIAEIEGYKKTGTVWGKCVIVSGEDDTVSYNPLTDDALCFQLMVKYDIDNSTAGYKRGDKTKKVYCAKKHDCTSSELVFDTNRNKTICLAIIEANKDKS